MVRCHANCVACPLMVFPLQHITYSPKHPFASAHTSSGRAMVPRGSSHPPRQARAAAAPFYCHLLSILEQHTTQSANIRSIGVGFHTHHACLTRSADRSRHGGVCAGMSFAWGAAPLRTSPNTTFQSSNLTPPFRSSLRGPCFGFLDFLPFVPTFHVCLDASGPSFMRLRAFIGGEVWWW